MSKIKVGIIGCGAIGVETAIALNTRFKNRAELVCVSELNATQKKKFDKKVGFKLKNVSVDECIDKADLVIEVASSTVVFEVLKKALKEKKDVLIMSVGGLLDHLELIEKFRKAGLHLYVPSGAIAGLDLLHGACMQNVYRVEVTTRKPTEALKDAPFVKNEKIDLDQIIGEAIIFEGKASEAVKAFPQNINVAATLSLAGIGSEKTRVKIVTSRTFKKNTHEIVIEGDFGKFHAVIENEPSHLNSKTSQLAIMSCIATLDRIFGGVAVGT